MKELSIEEKATRYDDAIKKAKSLYEVSEPLSGCNVIIETIFPELKESDDEKIVDAIRKALESKIEDLGNGVTRTACLAWLEKQDTPNQTSIWKHWKDGIAGNGEGKPIYLIKYGRTYSLSSYLCFECDYIELSELDKLMLEKQGEKKVNYTTLVETGNGGINALVTRELSTNGCDFEQKPAWSKEDQNAFEDVREAIGNYWGGETQDILLCWLKKLKQRIGG